MVNASRTTTAIVALVMAASLAGCFGRHGRRAAFIGILAIDAVARMAIASAHTRVVVVTPPSYDPGPGEPPPGNDDGLEPSTVIAANFDAAAAQTTLSEVDPTRCWPANSAPGYVTLHATFAPAGYVKTITLDTRPNEVQPEAPCLAQVFGAASVPPFTGSPVNVTARYYVGTPPASH